MGSGFLKKKKQAKMFQDQMSQMQEQLSQKLEQLEVTGTSGNGLVEITLNGAHEMKKIHIKPDCVDPEDVAGLEMLIKAAYQDATSQLQKSQDSIGMPDLSMFGM